MSELDKLENFSRIDQSDFLKNFREFPEQCEQAWKEVKEVVLPSYYIKANKIVIIGMGGSGISGDVIKALTAKKLNIPICVLKDYDLPNHIDKDSLVIAISYSGNTEETLEAFSQAISRKAKLIVISTGGQLTQLAQSRKLPYYQFNYPTQPRQAFGFLFTALLGILNKIAFVDIKDEDWRENILLLKALASKIKPEVPASKNQAKKLAEELQGKIIVVVGGGSLKPVAQRFKTQLNENSKQMAFWEELPEACHNFIVGLETPQELKENVFILSLSSKFDHQRVVVRRRAILEILNKQKIPHDELEIEPAPTVLSEMLSMLFLLDFVSYYLAILNKSNPEPIQNINYLKKKLEETSWQK